MPNTWSQRSPLPPPPSLGETYKPAPPVAIHQQVHNLVYPRPPPLNQQRSSGSSSLDPLRPTSPRKVRENAPSPSDSIQVTVGGEDENPWPKPDYTPIFPRRQNINDTPVTQHKLSSVGGQNQTHDLPLAPSINDLHRSGYTQYPPYPPIASSSQPPISSRNIPPPLATPDRPSLPMQTDNRGVNRVEVHNPRQWGPALPTQLHQDPGGWDEPYSPEDLKKAQVGQWAENVAPMSPSRSPVHSATAPSSPRGPIIDLPPRPDSARAALPPVKVFVSDDESTSPGPLTPHQIKNKKIKASDHPRVEGVDEIEIPWEVSDAETSFDQHTQPPRRYSGYSHIPDVPRIDHRGAWWKDHHPVYSPLYAGHRFFVKLPFRVRDHDMRSALTRHFSRWGSIRLIFVLESDGTASDKAAVVFHNPTSAETCLADPSRHDISFQSTPFADATNVTIETDRRAPHPLSQAIYLHLSGSRPDSIRRAASRASSQGSSKSHLEYPKKPLPKQAFIYARHYKSISGREQFAVHVLEQEVRWSSVSSRILLASGRSPEKIGEVDFSSRFTEADIVTRLSDFFGEVLDLHPSASSLGGWVIRLSNRRDARRALSELVKIPGITARYANPTDGDIGETPQVLPVELPPLEQLERDLAIPVPRQATPPSKNKKGPKSQRSARSNSAPAPMPNPATSPTDTMRPPIDSLGATSDVQFVLDGSPHPYHPILRRALVSVYKDNRAVVQEMINGDVCHIDKRAIHVGRLVKGSETRQTLLSRFAKYGTVADIEFNPQGAVTSYATARILYHSREAAVRALTYENGRSSFGSAIKVNERIVQESDVRLDEMFVDTSNGLIIAPAAAEQYSPPSLLPETEWLPPPPPMFPLPPQTYPYAPPAPHGMFFMPMFAPPALALADGYPVPPAHVQAGLPPNGTAPPQSMPMGMFYAPMSFPPTWYPPPPPLHLSPPRTPTPIAPSNLPQSDPSPVGSSPARAAAAEGPRVLETKYVDGVFSIVYEPRDLEAYCKAKGIRPEEMVFPHTLKARALGVSRESCARVGMEAMDEEVGGGEVLHKGFWLRGLT